ncbi:MAG: hypothetical protein R3B45_00860 [Bdellovibrionota bacterium]
MVRLSLIFVVFLTSFLIRPNVGTAEELRWTQYGLRPLGMGNAFVSVADDYNALFYNPAGLARLKEWDGEFLNPTIEVADTTISFVNDLMELGSESKNTVEVLELLQSHTGETHHLSMYLTPHLIFKNFGFALGLELETTLVAHSDIDIEFKFGPRIIAPISYAQNFLNDKLSVGGTVKFLARAGIDHSFNIDTISMLTKGDGEDSISELVEGGYAVGFDGGILFTPIKTMEPTLGISVADIGGSVYEKADVQGTAIGAPKTRLPSVNTGISFKPIQTNSMYVLVASDAHAINQPVHYSQKYNLGLEWGYGKIIKIQTGLKAGYLTGGFQFDVGLLNLRFATYTVDHAPVVGTHDALTERRFLVQIKLLI